MIIVTCWLRHVLLIASLLLSPWALAGTVLENPLWRVELDPATLAIRVIPAQKAPVQASAGVAAHKVSDLTDRKSVV